MSQWDGKERRRGDRKNPYFDLYDTMNEYKKFTDDHIEKIEVKQTNIEKSILTQCGKLDQLLLISNEIKNDVKIHVDMTKEENIHNRIFSKIEQNKTEMNKADADLDKRIDIVGLKSGFFGSVAGAVGGFISGLIK